MSKAPPRKSGLQGGAVDPTKVGLPPADQMAPAAERLQEEPWFAKLPPDMREAIRSNSQRRPPPGYDRRIQEYFENTDR